MSKSGTTSTRTGQALSGAYTEEGDEGSSEGSSDEDDDVESSSTLSKLSSERGISPVEHPGTPQSVD